MTMADNSHYKMLKTLEADPKISQRQLAENLGISLGKVNYCVKALLEKGLIKTTNFKNSNNKIAYAYLLTPKGIKQKTLFAQHFLEKTVLEYEQLKHEIQSPKAEPLPIPSLNDSIPHPQPGRGFTTP
jgi:EPS-associated MarR family transcriptional regulator